MPFSPSPSNALEWVAIFLESNLSFPGYPAIFRTFPDPLMVSSLNNPWFFQQIRPLVHWSVVQGYGFAELFGLGLTLSKSNRFTADAPPGFGCWRCWYTVLRRANDMNIHERFFPELIMHNMTHTHIYI